MESALSLRHALATLAYRAVRALNPAPEGFSEFRAHPGSRSAGEILAHMGDLMDWSAGLLAGDSSWRQQPAGEWDADKTRFFMGLTKLDQALRNNGDADLDEKLKRLFQGPIADALTHVGQLTLLRGFAGAPVKSENFFVADIAAGRTTQIQPSPKRTF